jgi:signal transduction histidine kinase
VAGHATETADPALLIARLTPRVRLLLGREIELRVIVPDRIGSVHVDPADLEQALVALVSSARDAMPAGGTLTVELLDVELGAEAVAGHPRLNVGSYVALAVSDTGRGMDTRRLADVFAPLRSGAASRSSLAHISGFANRAGGFVAAASDPGRGTDVTIYLPRARTARARVARPRQTT